MRHQFMLQCRTDSVYLMLRRLASHLCVLFAMPVMRFSRRTLTSGLAGNPSPKPRPLAPVFFDSDQEITLMRHTERLTHMSSMKSVGGMLNCDEASPVNSGYQWSLGALAVLSF